MKRILPLIILLQIWAVVRVWAQDKDNYGYQLAEARQYYENDLLDQAVLKASALITSDPARAEGYLLTALIFVKQNDLPKAKEVLQQATNKSTQEPSLTGQLVQAQITAREALNSYLAEGKKLMQEKQPLKAAEYYAKAYYLNQDQNLEYALEALNILLEQKDYFASLPLLQDLKKSANPQVAAYAEKLIARVNEVPEVKKEIQYQDYVKTADQQFKSKNFTAALSFYKKAYDLKNTPELQQKISEAQDELAFAKAEKENFLESYEAYRQQYPRGKYINRTHQLLQQSYLTLARKAGQAADYTKAEIMYQKYLQHYPDGTDISAAKTEYSELFYTQALLTIKSKKVPDLEKSYGFLKKAAANNHPKATAGRLDALAGKINRWSKPNHGFLAWHADSANPVGIAFGGLHNRKPAFYLAARTSSALFKTLADWKTNDENSTAEARDYSMVYAGESRNRSVFVTAGFTQKIVRPLWVYGGAGVVVTSQLKKFYSATNDESVWVLNEAKNQVSVNPEGGLQLLLGPVTLRYGVSKPIDNYFYAKLVHSLAFGFRL